MPRVRLDEKAIKQATLPPGKRQHILWCERAPGFGLLIGTRGKTFIVQRDLPGGKTRRVVLGRWAGCGGNLTLTDARQEAAKQYAALLGGTDPQAERRKRVRDQEQQAWETYTLKDARDNHLLNMKAKNCRQRSMDDFVESLDRYLSDWLDRPLADITPDQAQDRHRKITADHGPSVANTAFNIFRACYNSARSRYRNLPENPEAAIVKNIQFRKREPIEDVAAWYAKVQTIANPVRRDFHVFVLLTGLRGGDAVTVRFSEIDWDKGTLTRPNPKYGPRRAFTIPLSSYVLAMLAKRQMDNRILYGDSDYVFPTRLRCGPNAGTVTHMQEPKEQRYKKDAEGKVRKIGFLPSPHRSRDSFITTCETEAAIDPITVKALVNHSLPSGDVTTGYVRPGLEHMRKCVEKVNAIMLAKMGVPTVAPVAKGA